MNIIKKLLHIIIMSIAGFIINTAYSAPKMDPIKADQGQSEAANNTKKRKKSELQYIADGTDRALEKSGNQLQQALDDARRNIEIYNIK